jgi:hypothetical protein
MNLQVQEYHIYRNKEIELHLEKDLFQVIEEYNAYAIIDLIAFYQYNYQFNQETFQTWSFMKEEVGWRVIVKDGNVKLLLKSIVEFPDYLFTEIRIWVVDNKILLLSSLQPHGYSGIF